MHTLENVIQDYAWGSHTAIAELLGAESPTSRPQAELWMGAHPMGPSRVDGRPLTTLVADDPVSWLGERVVRRFGSRLPFLLKVLAAAEPLSLQAHPTPAQAEAGFDADELARIPLDAKHRNYKDKSHKPELICALTPFHALCGFRPVSETLELLRELFGAELSVGGVGPSVLAGVLDTLHAAPDAQGLRTVFSTLMTLDEEPSRAAVNTTLEACRERAQSPSRFAHVYRWTLRLGAKYPTDIGVVSSLLLNNVTLEPGEAIYLPAGNLHAYLEGVGVEIMASSDNVLRGGLTPKHVNVEELLRILDFAPRTVPKVAPQGDGFERLYPTPTAEFLLSRIELAGEAWRGVPSGPEILVCTEGEFELSNGRHIGLPRGRAVIVPGSSSGYTLTGKGTVFRARVPE